MPTKKQKKAARAATRKSRRVQGLEPEELQEDMQNVRSKNRGRQGPPPVNEMASSVRSQQLKDLEDQLAKNIEALQRLKQIAPEALASVPAAAPVAASANVPAPSVRSKGSTHSYDPSDSPSVRNLASNKAGSVAKSKATNVTRRSQELSEIVTRRETELMQLKELAEVENRAAAIRRSLNMPEELGENESQMVSDDELEIEDINHKKTDEWLRKSKVAQSDLCSVADVEDFQLKEPADGIQMEKIKESSIVEIEKDSEVTTAAELMSVMKRFFQGANVTKTPQTDEVKQIIVRQTMGKPLPEFYGNPEEWPGFIEEYRRTTEVCNFTDGENLYRLRKSLKGKALDTVKAMLIVPDNVPTIVKALESNFGQPELIIKAMVRKARDIPLVSESKPQMLIDLANSVRNLVTTVTHLKNEAYLMNPELVSQLANKLPESERKRWVEEKVVKKYNSLTEFSAWLNERGQIANELKILDPYVKEQKKIRFDEKRNSKSNNGNKDYRKTEVVLASSSKPTYADPPFANNKKCNFCDKSGHLIYTCRKFLGLSVNDRWRWTREKKSCYSCLENNHVLSKCPNQTECGTNGCPQWHHRHLHPPGWKSVEQQEEENKTPEEREKTNMIGHISEMKVPSNRILLRVLPVVLQGPNGEVKTFALLDEASTTTIVEENLAKSLGAKGDNQLVANQWINGQTETKVTQLIKLQIRNPWNKNYYVMENVQTDKELHLPVQSVSGKDMMKKWPHLQGLDFLKLQDARPLILIGQDNVGLIIPREIREGPNNAPIASRCVLGWAIHGRNESKYRVDCNFTLHVYQKFKPVVNGFLHGGELDAAAEDLDSLHQLVKQQFSTESFGVKIKEENLLSKEDKRVLQIAEATTKKIGDRWETGLMWRNDDVKLPPSKHTALNRLFQMERRMDRKPEFGDAYCKKMQEFVEKGYARKLSDIEVSHENARTWYLPHFGHVNPNKPGKIRLVFDAAAKSNGASLNDHLLKGLNLVTPLPVCIFGFREKAVGYCGDIKKMFPQVRIREEDQDSQRFLFRGMNRSVPPDVYVMQAMIFGSASSPFSAQFVKNKNAECYSDEFPQAAEAIIKKHYVDDFLNSNDTEEEAIQLIKDVDKIHSRGGFKIVNFTSNSRKVLEGIPEEMVADNHKDLSLEDEYPVERVLGLYWDSKLDCFSFRTSFKRFRENVMTGENSPTKREVLAIVMTVYDILGFISHFTIKARLLLQDIWRIKIDWDDELPPELFEKWKMWLEELKEISTVKIARCYTPKMTDGDIQLHVFVDASKKAFAAVAYFRINIEGNVTTSLVMSKAKVSPLKPLSIPRLELQAAVLGCRMTDAVKSGHSIPISAIYYWSDSKTVLCWLRYCGSRRLSPFVAHRVGEIMESTNVDDWHWVPTKLNVADDATRDGNPTDFEEDSRWFHGPVFLKEEKCKWPKELSERELKDGVRDEDLETSDFVGLVAAKPPIIEWSRFSNFNRLRRTMVYLRRFSLVYVSSCKQQNAKATDNPSLPGKVKLKPARDIRASLRSAKKRTRDIPTPIRDNLSSAITVEELERAEIDLIRIAQSESFSIEAVTLNKGKMGMKTSRLVKLSPMKDDRGLICVRGRIINAPGIDSGARKPIILDPKHPLTKLIIQKYHEKCDHIGVERVLNELRQKFWILEGRAAVKKVWNDCQRCKIARAKPTVPEMAPLPEFRLTRQLKPFTITGLDYFGPMTITVGRRHEKRYGALFTCLSTRAVHVEVAASMSTDSAIMAIRRFIARRGCPAELHSDNGSNFHGANNELRKSLAELDQNRMEEELVEKGIRWKFIPPGAPHMGGAWERLVRSIKTSLYATLKEQAPKEEVLTTLLAEAEYSVNSRPLTRVSGDPDDLEALTPNHFLLGTSSGVHQWGTFDATYLCLRKQWRISQALADGFWKKWLKEYLPSLTERSKWQSSATPVKVGDVVFIADGNLKRNLWPRGKVTATYPGKDGHIRVVDVKTNHGDFRRPVKKIAVLDVGPLEERIVQETNSGGEGVGTRGRSKQGV